MHKHKEIDNFFAHASRFTIIIPIVVIFLALGFKVSDMISPKQPFSTPSPTQTPVQNSPTKSPSVKLDLKGPYICNYQSSEATVSAFIKDRNVSITNQKKSETDYFVLRGDCLYIWEKGSFAGEKVCGLGSYISLAEMFSQLGGGFSLTGSLSTLKNVIPESSSQTARSFQSFDLNKALESCRKKEVTNASVFDIPQNILFKNIHVEDLQNSKTVNPTP